MAKPEVLFSATLGLDSDNSGGASPVIDLEDVSSLLFVSNILGLGASSSLTIFVDVQDAGGNWVNVYSESQSLAGVVKTSIGPGLPVNMTLPRAARVTWSVGGTVNVTLSLFGR